MSAPGTSRLRGPAVSRGLAWLSVGCGTLALLDPRGASLGWLSVVASASAVVASRRSNSGAPGPLLAAVLGATLGVAALGHPRFRADAPGYYVYLRSLAFDGDLDFADEWEVWGFPPQPVTSTGLRQNLYPVGPALLWGPFFALSHVYVSALGAAGDTSYAADGYSEPYLRSTALGTIVVAVLGGWLLARLMAGWLGWPTALVGVLGTVLVSPMVYYVVVVPSMAHGLTFGLSAALLWALDRARRTPGLAGWGLVGALTGLLALTRWQALVVVLLVGSVAVAGLAQRTLRPLWLVAAAAAALLAFTPQLAAWWLLYGRLVTIPQGADWIDWSSPYLADVLVSANHGLFSWTPMLAVALLGLCAWLRRDPALVLGGLATFAATAWVNGSVRDFSGSDAFGARRFDLVVPLLALGMAVAFRGLSERVRRQPQSVGIAVLAAAAAWNLGLIRLYHQQTFWSAAPPERLAAAQVRQLRSLVERGLVRLGGPAGRALAYKVFVGEYMYDNVLSDGRIDVGALDSPYLAEGWSPARRRPEEPSFRWALFPEACLRVPLARPLGLSATLLGRRPRRLADQAVVVVVNGTAVASFRLADAWSESAFEVPARATRSGENHVCFRFAAAAAGEEGGRVAAAVAWVQFP